MWNLQSHHTLEPKKNKMSQDQTHQPKSVLWRIAGYENFISSQMGMIDFNQGWSNAFAMMKAIIKLIESVNIAIEQKTIKIKDELRLDRPAVEKLDRIWNGTCYYGINHYNGKLSRTFLYSYPVNPYEEIITLPKLRNMIPVGEIDSDTLGIQIRESFPLKYAWENTDYDTVVKDGKFFSEFSDEIVPRFEREDLESLTKEVYVIKRPVYNQIIGDYEMFFNRHWATVSNNIQAILDYVQLGEDDEDEYDYDESGIMAELE